MNVSKHSKQRDAILEVLHSTKAHPTADAIYEEVRKKIPNISLGTVYRNLAKLSEDNTIIKVNAGTGVEHFDGTPTPHYHVVCTECGAIDDIDADPLEEVNVWAAKIFKGEIYKHSTIFFGKCERCKN
ncbi:MAG: transcriptional repressor [Clostridia bacterium]|nr:transcriptional repressor [Clostridia bacterium]